MVSRLIYAPAMAATVAYAGISAEHPQVAQAEGTTLKDTARAFAYTDFSVGFAVGFYGSLISYAYDDDCFTGFFSFAFNNIMQS